MKYRNFVLNLLFFVLGMVSSLPGVLSTFWTTTFHLDASTLGMVFSIQFGACLIGVLAAGWWSDRLGKRPLIRLGGFLLTLGFFLVGISSFLGDRFGFLDLLTGLAVSGLGMGLLDVTGSAFCADANRPDPTRALGFLNFAFAAGAIAGPGLVLILGSGLQGLTPVLTSGIAALGFVFSYAPSFHEPEPSPSSGRPRFTKGKRFLAVAGFMILLYACIEGGLSSWLPYYWTKSQLEVLTFLPIKPASTSLGFWTFLTLGRLLYSRFAGRWRVDSFLLGASSVLTGASLVWLAAGAGPWLVLVIALLGLGCAGVFPAVITAVTTRFPDMTGAAGSIVMISASLGSIIWPTLTGWGFDRIGTTWFPFLLTVCSAGIALISLRWVLRRVTTTQENGRS